MLLDERKFWNEYVEIDFDESKRFILIKIVLQYDYELSQISA